MRRGLIAATTSCQKVAETLAANLSPRAGQHWQASATHFIRYSRVRLCQPAVLTRLFAEHAPPLVLKSDNGKALTQGGVPALHAQHEMTPLISPVYRPQYNGSCEAGVKAMKTRTEDAANLADRSRHWTAEDLAHALQIANEHHRRGPHSPSKLQCWQKRPPIAPEERDAFLLTLAINRALHLATRPGPLTKQQTKTLERQSVAQTLVELGLLIIHRRPNTTPKKEQKADRIS